MRRLGLVLVASGAVGLTFVALGFASDFQPMWMHSAKNLPDKQAFTRAEVVGALTNHVEHVRNRYLLGLLFSSLEIVGAVVLIKSSSKPMARAS